MMREPIDRPKPRPTRTIVLGRGPRILLEQSNEAEQEQRHRRRERRVLRVHEHVPVVERAGGEQQQRQQARKRPADPPPDPPGDGEAGDADDGSEQPPRFEQIERHDLGEQRRRHVEAAAVEVEVDERERAGVVEAGRIQLEAAGRRTASGCSRPSRGRNRGRSRRRSPPAPPARRWQRGRASGFASRLRHVVHERFKAGERANESGASRPRSHKLRNRRGVTCWRPGTSRRRSPS